MTDISVAGSHWAAALREPNLRWYLGGQVVLLTGNMLQVSVQALLIISIAGKEHAATWTGLVGALNYLPGIVLAPFGGVLIDRFNKRAVMLTTGGISALQALALSYLTYTGQATLLAVNACALVLGFVNAVDGPARNAIVKDAVGEERARIASKMFTSLYTVALMAGPGLAAYLILTFGYPTAFALNALTFVALAVALGNMTLAVRAKPTHAVLRSVIHGGAYTLRNSIVRLCIGVTTVISIFGYSVVMLLPVINKYQLAGDERTYGYLGACNGVGALVGSFIIIALEHTSHRRLIMAGLVPQGVTVLALAFVSSVWVAYPLLFVLGVGNMVSFSAARSSAVHHVDTKLIGVVMGYNFSFMYLSMVIGSFGMGTLADHVGLPLMLGLCGVALMTTGALLPLLPGATELD